MTTKSAQLRAEPHNLIGAVIGRDAGIIVDKWARRAIDEQSVAKRVHHDVLLDHLPTFLWELGKGLADANPADSFRHCRPAGLHGDQRWETGWSIDEVVRDYQLLRIVVIEHFIHDSVDRRAYHARNNGPGGLFRRCDRFQRQGLSRLFHLGCRG